MSRRAKSSLLITRHFVMRVWCRLIASVVAHSAAAALSAGHTQPETPAAVLVQLGGSLYPVLPPDRVQNVPPRQTGAAFAVRMRALARTSTSVRAAPGPATAPDRPCSVTA